DTVPLRELLSPRSMVPPNASTVKLAPSAEEDWISRPLEFCVIPAGPPPIPAVADSDAVERTLSSNAIAPAANRLSPPVETGAPTVSPPAVVVSVTPPVVVIPLNGSDIAPCIIAGTGNQLPSRLTPASNPLSVPTVSAPPLVSDRLGLAPSR